MNLMKIILYPRQKNLGLVTINESDHRELLQPSKSKLEQHASRIDHLLVPENEVHRLRDIESTPSREFIETKAAQHDLVTLTRKEHSELTSNANEPSKDHIIAKASAIGLVAISKKNTNKR